MTQEFITVAQARARIPELETAHVHRRRWVWGAIGGSQLARAVEPLSRLANLNARLLAAATSGQPAELHPRLPVLVCPAA